MYGKLVAKDKLLAYEAKADAYEISVFLDAFQEGAVHVYYNFNGKDVVYYAVYQDEFAQVVLHLNGNFEILHTTLSIALLHYVVEMDEKADEETLENRYGADYATMHRLMELGAKKAEAYFNAVKKVDALARSLSTAERESTSRKPKILFCAEMNRGWCQVFLRVGFSKLLVNRKPIQFFQAYHSHQLIQIQKEYVTLPPNSFDPQEEAAFQYIYNVGTSHSYWSSSSPLELKTEELMQMLSMLEGHNVEINKVTYQVLPCQSIELTLNEDGELIPSISLEKKGLVRVGKWAYRLGTNQIELYSFASEKAGQIFDFYASLKGVDSTYLSQEIAAKVLPSLSDKEVHIEAGFEAKYPIYRPRIEYYVGLETHDVISIHTEYRFGPEKVSGEVFSYRSELCMMKRQGFLDVLKAYGFPENGTLEGGDEVLSFLRADLGKINECANVYVSEELQAMRVLKSPQINIRASSGQDWFSIELYSSGYSEEELIAMLSAYHKKKKYVRFDNRFILIDDEDSSLSAIADSFQDEDIGAELPLYQALKLPNLGAETDGKVKELIQSLQDYGDVDVTLTPELEDAARPYQRQGIRFLVNLYRNHLSGILSDDMGLGKTLQSFGLFHNIEEEMPILVVCPKSLIYNWMDEKKKWSPSLTAYVLDGTPSERKAIYKKMKQKKKAVYFVSYDTLRNDIKELEGVEFSLALLDEGQYISNAKALKTKAVKELNALARIVLTGTPIQNSLIDLWSIFDFLLPGYFPPLSKYREQFGDLEFASEESRARLLAKVKPFVLGRKKSDVLKELPDKENIEITLPMSEPQRLVYESHLALARQYLSEEGGMMKALAMMTRLRQICITPALFLDGDYPSSKIEELVDMLIGLKKSGRKAIVFSSFVTALDLIQDALKKAGLSSESITGKTSAKMRIILADRFNEENSPIDVMLVSLKAGGTGLNLTGADTVFHLDPWWNIAAERQAEDRAHRIGQKNKVTVFKFLIKDSIEEKVLALQKMKGLLIDLADEASLEGALTEEDYKFLLS